MPIATVKVPAAANPNGTGEDTGRIACVSLFDGNVITTAFDLYFLACAAPGMPLDCPRAANPNLDRLQRPCHHGLAPDLRLLQPVVAGSLVFFRSTDFFGVMQSDLAATVQIAWCFPFDSDGTGPLEAHPV